MIIKKNKKICIFDSKICKPYRITDKQGGSFFYSPSLSKVERYEELSFPTNGGSHKTQNRKYKLGKDLSDA